MTKKMQKLAVLFADICGSTVLYDKLGDQLARRLVESCINLMAKEVNAHQGSLIKTIGDEIMCTFPNAEMALRAACAIQTAVKQTQFENNTTICVRVGLHYGDVICEANDVFGDTVNVAARVTSVSKAEQIILSQDALDSLPVELKNKTHQIMAGEFKGKQEQQAIFKMIWDEQEQDAHTSFVAPMKDIAKTEAELTLVYQAEEFKINRDCRGVIVGRGDSCDIVVQSDYVSRQHARIELRFGKFFLIDQSTNGTYVRFDWNNNVVTVSRQEFVLIGSGVINLGQEKFDEPEKLIRFSVS